jgi:hypothetical protein
MRASTLSALIAAAVTLSNPAAHAQPTHGGGHLGSAGGHWAGYRHGYGPGYGYGGWHYGYPRYGYGYGLGIGVGLGYAAGWGWPWYWGAPVYAAAPYYPYGYVASDYPALVLNQDPTYVEQPQAAAGSYWYYCNAPAGYYPYVQHCSKPWVPVRPQATPPVGSAPSGAPVQ